MPVDIRIEIAQCRLDPSISHRFLCLVVPLQCNCLLVSNAGSQFCHSVLGRKGGTNCRKGSHHARYMITDHRPQHRHCWQNDGKLLGVSNGQEYVNIDCKQLQIPLNTPHPTPIVPIPTSSIQYVHPSSPFPPHPLSTAAWPLISSLSWLSLAFSILTSYSSSLCLLLFLSSSSNLFLSTVHLLDQPLR